MNRIPISDSDREMLCSMIPDLDKSAPENFAAHVARAYRAMHDKLSGSRQTLSLTLPQSDDRTISDRMIAMASEPWKGVASTMP